MARPPSFTKSDLAWECSQVKRKLLNDARSGRLTRLSKSDVYDLIALRPKIGLKSSRMLWSGTHREYLEGWFDKLNQEVMVIMQPNSEKESLMAQPELFLTEHQELQAKVIHLTRLIKTYKEALDQLRLENTKYRELITQRFGNIDDIV